MRYNQLLSPSMRAAIFPVLFSLTACSSYFSQNDSAVSYEEVKLSEKDRQSTESAVSRQSLLVPPVSSSADDQPAGEYRLGAGDEVTVNVNGEPSMEAVVSRVDNDGYIQLPIINRLRVLDQTTTGIQKALVAEYSREFVDPWVVVSISKFRSRPIYMLGEFNSPGVIHMERPTNITQALGLAGGMTTDAHLRSVRLLRDNRIVAVDVEALLNRGSFDQNVWLRPGDTLFAPSVTDLRVYVLGAVARPGVLPFRQGLSALAAISSSGGIVRGEARLRETRIVRTHSPIKGELITIDAASMLQGGRPDFMLEPGDIVFVPNTPIASWNDVVQQIAPSVQLVGTVLEPFVQIEFLLNED